MLEFTLHGIPCTYHIYRHSEQETISQLDAEKDAFARELEHAEA
jgi:hypothetical protein